MQQSKDYYASMGLTLSASKNKNSCTTYWGIYKPRIKEATSEDICTGRLLSLRLVISLYRQGERLLVFSCVHDAFVKFLGQQ